MVLTGEGDRAFCVGLDLDLLDKAFADLDYFDTVVGRVSRIIAALEALPVPTLAAINGVTRAGGFEFSLGCDFVIVADEADFGDAHTDSGVLPAAVTTRLKRKIGDQKAKALIWSARYLRGQEAVDWGLAIKSVPRAQLLAEAKAFLASIVDKPRATLGRQQGHPADYPRHDPRKPPSPSSSKPSPTTTVPNPMAARATPPSAKSARPSWKIA